MTAARVLLVDDDPQVRRSLRLMLRFETEFDVVGDTATAAQATQAAADLQPDIVLLDLGLPDLAGRDLLSAIRHSSPVSRVVVFTGREPDDRQFWADNASAYVMKGAEADHLLQVLRTQASPAAWPEPEEADASVGRRFPGTLDSVPAARAFLLDQLRRWRLTGDDAALIMTELAANAVRHAGTAFHLRLSRGPGSLRIEIDDASSLTPEPQPFSDTAEGGRGMVLVSVLAQSWGIEPLPGGGKTVWAEVATRGDQDAQESDTGIGGPRP